MDTGEKSGLDAMSKELRAEHDQLQAQLDKEPPASNVVVHPAAVAAFAERLKASRIKLETALHLLEGTGDLHRMIREVVASVTLYRDDEKRMVAHITTLLDPFTAEGTAAMGKIHNPEGGCQVGSGGGIHHRLITNCFIVIYLSISPIIPPAIPPFRDLCDDWKFDRGKPFHLPRVAGQKGSLDASVEARLRGKPTCGRAPQFRRAKLTSPAMTDELTKRRIWRLPTAR